MIEELFAKAEQEWAQAWVAAWAELPDIKQGKTVTIKHEKGTFTYTYAPLDYILDQVRGVLNKHGLAIAQSAVQAQGGVAVETRIIHKGGHTEVYGPTFIAVSGDAKAVGSATTYARRYGLIAALGLATEEDDDGERAAPRKRIPKDDIWDYVVEHIDTKERTEVFKAALEIAQVPLDKANTATTKQAEVAIDYIKGLGA